MILSAKQFPSLLQQLHPLPHLLYIEGSSALLAKPAIAIVGSRAMTAYGEQACRSLTQQCVAAGLTIVSGLATGVDAIAHLTALDYGGKTIAVLGSGLNPEVLFPAAHRQLAKRIVQQGGALVSEYPDATIARRHHFIARNRILAALSLGTIIVEAAERSGAINTAYHTLDLNRPVFAVPGSIFSSRSVGTHRLIQQGAILVQSMNDILQELNLPPQLAMQQSTQPLSAVQQQIIHYLTDQPKAAETLVQLLNINSATLQANLTELEIQGIVRKNLWMLYEISHR